MKRIFTLICPLLLILVIVFSACTDKPQQETASGNSQPVVTGSETQQTGTAESDRPSLTDSETVTTSTEEEETIPDEIVDTIGEDEEVFGN